MTIVEALKKVAWAWGDDAPRTCLWIGDGDHFAAALAEMVPTGGALRKVFVAGDPRVAGAVLPGSVATTHLDGPLIAASDFPALADVVAFAQARPAPVDTVTLFSDALASAKATNGVPTALAMMAAAVPSSDVDLVVIDDEAILTGRVVETMLGAKAFLFSNIRDSFGGAAAFATLFASPDYKLVASDEADQDSWALFVRRAPPLPVHFFTIVLNGEPFIRYHEMMLRELPFLWHWHIVEGVASLVKDTAWSIAAGGHIPDEIHRGGLSNDGTSEYLNDLARRYPDRVTIYRKGQGRFWDGKLEMVNAPLPNIDEECLLWQVDSDELWTSEQIAAVRERFIAEPDRTAAYFWCNYYVGPDRGITTRFNYAQNPRQEWLRLWRFKPGMIWDKHEPPVLKGTGATGEYDVGRRHAFSHREMELCGAVFDHFAYATEAQVRFKESYYGYAEAVRQWRKLQAAPPQSGYLRDYLAWVSDDTMFDTVERMEWTPLAVKNGETGAWQFRDSAELDRVRAAAPAHHEPVIVVDGVFFQLSSSGIARLWVNLLREWLRLPFGGQVILLDRGGSAPRIKGLRYHSIEAHSWSSVDDDARHLQDVCDRLGATLFLSTYYTTPLTTPTIFMGYDMIPEALGFDLDDPWWRQKRRAIQHASGHVMISQSSADQLARYFPFADADRTLVAHCSVDSVFIPCSDAEVEAFRRRFAIDGDFVMLVGDRVGWKGYKNGTVVFAALAQIAKSRRPTLVCVGGGQELEEAAKALLDPDDVRLLRLDDADLRLCYGAALAYICPSLMEGFGLPIVEAMAVGVPALVCRNSSIPEVAGEAGVYFDPNDPRSLIQAINLVRDPAMRADIIAAGHEQAATFDQSRSAWAIARFCCATVDRLGGERRLDAGILTDAFSEAEHHRVATTTLAAVERGLFTAKTELATMARTQQLVLADLARAGDHISSETMQRAADIQSRISNLYAILRDPHVAIVQDEAPTAFVGRSPLAKAETDGIALVETTGLAPIEGPYPTLQIFNPFRWQTAAMSVATFSIAEPMDAWLEVQLGNIEADQRIYLLMEGKPLVSFHPEQLGWQYVWSILVPITVNAGMLSISVQADVCHHADVDNRSLYMAIYDMRIIPRKASDTDQTSITDVGLNRELEGTAASGSEVEVPAVLVETTGLGEREGPFEHFGVLRSFRWQTADVSDHLFQSEIVADASLQIEFGNVQPDQSVVVLQDDTVLATFRPPVVGWAHQWRMEIPIRIEAGSTHIRIRSDRYVTEDATGRHMYIGIYDLRLVLRSGEGEEGARVVDLMDEGGAPAMLAAS